MYDIRFIRWYQMKNTYSAALHHHSFHFSTRGTILLRLRQCLASARPDPLPLPLPCRRASAAIEFFAERTNPFVLFQFDWIALFCPNCLYGFAALDSDLTDYHHHQSTPLHVRNKTPLILASAAVRRFPAAASAANDNEELTVEERNLLSVAAAHSNNTTVTREMVRVKIREEKREEGLAQARAAMRIAALTGTNLTTDDNDDILAGSVYQNP